MNLPEATKAATIPDMSKERDPILVVEDVSQIRELLEVTLNFKGYPVITAGDGQEALEKVAEKRPALIITDILMPKMDGYSLVYRLRKNPETHDIPIVFLSATYVTPEDKQFAMNLGAVRFLEKPIDTPEFLLTVGEILTNGPETQPRLIDDLSFYQGYRERLEFKLRQKNQQIARIERLLNSMGDTQQPAFRDLLDEAKEHRDQIKSELEEIIHTIKKIEAKN
ncbi:MAG: response regulator [Chloroflexi bacterium]|nr:MAG: response regulator [Chloroflexota bacterium]MBL1197471.1 response regulator [Chloroflexota bacterium]NOH14766.1 response regulator [Chloroflexota bacterium]